MNKAKLVSMVKEDREAILSNTGIRTCGTCINILHIEDNSVMLHVSDKVHNKYNVLLKYSDTECSLNVERNSELKKWDVSYRDNIWQFETNGKMYLKSGGRDNMLLEDYYVFDNASVTWDNLSTIARDIGFKELLCTVIPRLENYSHDSKYYNLFSFLYQYKAKMDDLNILKHNFVTQCSGKMNRLEINNDKKLVSTKDVWELKMHDLSIGTFFELFVNEECVLGMNNIASPELKNRYILDKTYGKKHFEWLNMFRYMGNSDYDNFMNTIDELLSIKRTRATTNIKTIEYEEL